MSNDHRANNVTKRLLDLIDQFNYQLVQENGQRRLTSASSEPRTKGAEIFLGRLPRDCYEDELVPLLTKVGRVVELRLMMDFSGSTRGYAFALFEHPRIARRACEELNGYEIRDGHKIGVVKSIDNCRLFLGGVPKDKTRADFIQELGKMLDGITNVYVYPSTEDKMLNRGFVFVEFKDHRSAAMARRKLIPGRVMLWDHEVAVDWADPEPGQDIDEEVMETVSALFVRNLALTSTESEIRNAIQQITGVPIMKIKKINHFAFMHYETRAQAQRVLDVMRHSRVAEMSEWELTWAKPIRKSEKLQERLRCTKGGNEVINGRETAQRENGGKGKFQNRQRDTKTLNLQGTAAVSQDGIHRDRNSYAGMINTSLNSVTTNKNKTGTVSKPINQNEAFSHPDDHGQGFYYCNNAINDLQMLQAPAYNDPTLSECARALGELAAKQFHANLRYEYWSDATGSDYFCKIIIERNGCELMSYQGNPASTVHEAFGITLKNAHASMQSMLMHAINYI